MRANQKVRIAVDAMGGDYAPGEVVKGAVLAVEKGDVEKGFKEADKIIEFKVRRNAHLWAGAELPSVVVRWRGEKLEMWLHEQAHEQGHCLYAISGGVIWREK